MRKVPTDGAVSSSVKARLAAALLAIGCAPRQARAPAVETDAAAAIPLEATVAARPDAGAKACAPLPPGVRPVLVDTDVISVTCGRCGPECQERIAKSDLPEWRLLLATPPKASLLFAGGEFGEPGKSAIRGPAWETYLVFETPPPPETRDTWRVDVDGVRPFVGTSWVDSFGSLEASVMLFGDQLPQGWHTITVTACDGTVLISRRVELVARHEY